jgi:hypothetical protein
MNGFTRALATGLLVALGVSGCVSYPVPRYTSSVKNVFALKTVMSSAKVNVGTFTQATVGADRLASTRTCGKNGPLESDSGADAANYLREAFISELMLAGGYDPQSKTTISGRLDDLTITANARQVTARLTLVSTTGGTLSVARSWNPPVIFGGTEPCVVVAQSFVGGAQDLISDAVNNPSFATLVTTATK